MIRHFAGRRALVGVFRTLPALACVAPISCAQVTVPIGAQQRTSEVYLPHFTRGALHQV